MDELINNWKENSVEKYTENLAFLRTLKDNKAWDQRASEVHDQVFACTDCLKCANCCTTTPAIVERSDVKRIAKHLSMPPKSFIRKYLIEDVNGELMFQKVPCVFLDADNLCKIYDVRPKACREYPHTAQDGFYRRSKLNANNTLVCPAAFEIVERLKSI